MHSLIYQSEHGQNHSFGLSLGPYSYRLVGSSSTLCWPLGQEGRQAEGVTEALYLVHEHK